MHFSALLVPVLAAVAAAESTTVIEYFAATSTVSGLSVSFTSYSSLAGTVLGSDAAGTTYRVGCMSDAPKSDCSIDHPFTMVAGENTLSYSKALTAELGGYTGLIGEDVQCSFTHSTESAACTFTMDVTVSSDDVTTSTQTTTTISYPEKSVTYDKLTVAATTTGSSDASATGASSTDAAAGHKPRATAVPLGAAAAIAVAALF
ncbi:uncharacterized protein N7498_007556 [Penicillium cinerascens]|uniref:Uncharacterized protein n=1 Tax=Penicillium cinerascens TaxID=70096 RepID=A0A9W9JLC1_9EURO|nr:uncharacterized protein N7498_007556 [Penicillium cinerascens]KAJ5198439.1 hypothetical protein N7498_007556 [Penicillium cinerascens]